MNRHPTDPAGPQEADPTLPVPTRPTLRLVSSRGDESDFERPDDGLRRLLRAPPRPRADRNDDDPCPSAA